MTEGDYPKTDGQILYASEFNTSINSIKQFYTGTALNVDNGTPGPVSLELDPQPPTTRGYAVIKINGSALVAGNNPNGNTNITYVLEIKETAGSYSTIQSGSYLRFIGDGIAGSANVAVSCDKTLEVYHPLTSNQKINGYQIRITMECVAGGLSASFTNNQIILSEDGY